MVCTVNASSSSSAIVSTADGSGILKIMSNGVTTNALAWVNFAASRSITPRASYNVSSVTSSAAGTFAVNFTNALSDANYCAVMTGSDTNGTGIVGCVTNATTVPTTSAYNFFVGSGWVFGTTSSTKVDCTYMSVIIFGN